MSENSEIFINTGEDITMSNNDAVILPSGSREFYMLAAKRLLDIINKESGVSTGDEVKDHDSFLYGYVHSSMDSNLRPEFYPNLAANCSENQRSIRSVTKLAYYSCKFASISGIAIADKMSYKQGYLERARHDNPFLDDHEDTLPKTVEPQKQTKGI